MKGEIAKMCDIMSKHMLEKRS